MAGDYGSVTVSLGQVVLTEKDGIAYTFGTDGALTSIEYTNGNTLSFSYVGGRLTEICHSNGECLVIGYMFLGDGSSRIQTVTDPSGAIASYYYDGSGEHLMRIEKSPGVTVDYTYHPAGTPEAHALATIIFPDETHQYYAYDTKGRISETWNDGGAERVTYQYDDQGTVTKTDALGHASVTRQDLGGEILEYSDPLGRITSFVYNEKGEIGQKIYPNGTSHIYLYDSKGNTIGHGLPNNAVVRKVFESQRSRMTDLADVRSFETAYAYDGNGNISEVFYPDSHSTSYSYDAHGNINTYTNGRQDTIEYTYNGRGQLTRKTYPDARTVSYEYDDRGNIVAAEDSVTGRIDMEYDIRNLMTRISYPGGNWFTFGYNDSGRRTKRTGHDGVVLDYYYDQASRMERLEISGPPPVGGPSELVRYQYDNSGRLVREDKGNGTYTTYEYDAAGQLLRLANFSPAGVGQSRFDYTYDVHGNRTSMTTLDGTVFSYEYDGMGQLLHATSSIVHPGGELSYEYDVAGNRVGVTQDGILTGYSVDSMNCYTHIGSASYFYDDDGNLTSKTDGEGTTTYHYDAENRLERVVTPSNGTWEYSYDALGNRFKTNHDGVIKKYVFDPMDYGNVAEEYDGSGGLVARFFQGLGLLEKIDPAGNGAFYHFDGTGHTRQMTDSGGNIINTYDYGPFGKSLLIDESTANPFRYVGKYGVFHDGNGLHFMRKRYYESKIGRFLSVDPIASELGEKSSYAYAGNNPITGIDPLGLSDVPSGVTDLYKQSSNPFQNLYNRSVIIDAMSRGGADNPNAIEEARAERRRQVEEPVRKLAEAGKEMGWSYALDWFLTGFKSLKLLKDALFLLYDLGELTLEQLKELLKQNACPADNSGFSTMDESTECYLKEVAEDESEVITPEDPNEKSGPEGVGEGRYITAGETMAYTVYFENKAAASASAQEVFVDDYLDSSLDWSTFKLGEISFGDYLVSSLSGQEWGQDQVLIGDNLVVDIEARRFPGTGMVHWHFKTLDVDTGDWPEDPYAGFLPPEDGTGRGQGYVTFTIKARDDLTAGTVISNAADIVFDTNAAITTNEVYNTISDAAPTGPIVPGIVDGAADVYVSTVLSWTPCDFATSYDIFLWQVGDPKPVAPTAGGLLSPFYEPTVLYYDRDYRWQVIARNVMGDYISPEWTFSTGMDPFACVGDNDEDGDVDGSDLATFANNPGGVTIEDFAYHYSRTDCP